MKPPKKGVEVMEWKQEHTEMLIQSVAFFRIKPSFADKLLIEALPSQAELEKPCTIADRFNDEDTFYHVPIYYRAIALNKEALESELEGWQASLANPDCFINNATTASGKAERKRFVAKEIIRVRNDIFTCFQALQYLSTFYVYR